MNSFIVMASCSGLLFLTGCGTNPIKPYQPASPSTSERTVQESGVEVALDPFVESSRTGEYFDIDALDKGIAILHVRVANKTSDQTFLVERKNFQLSKEGDANGLTGDGAKNEHSNATGNTAAWIGAVSGGVGGVGLIFMGGGMVSHSTQIQRNFTDKEMGDASLSPGESLEGFIYFAPVDHGKDWSRNASVKINLTETKTRRVIELNIPLSR
jgi:hypothetical protein